MAMVIQSTECLSFFKVRSITIIAKNDYVFKGW